MIIRLCVNQDSNNTINKTLSLGVEINVNFKNDLDIYNPLIMLMNIEGVDYADFNYCVIEGLGRSYFIESFERVNNRLSKISLVTDVIETFKADILGAKALYSRGVKVGDYQDVSLTPNLNPKSSFYDSSLEIELGVSFILSTVGA